MRLITGTTRARPSWASRGKVGTVAAGTPKNGTNTESVGPRSMSGRRYSASPDRKACTRLRRLSCFSTSRTVPYFKRPARIHWSMATFRWRAYRLMKLRENPRDSAAPPASSPTKWGANIATAPSAERASRSPVKVMRERTKASSAPQIQPRSSQDCANATKCFRTARWHWASVWSGKHSAQLVRAIRRRLAARRCSKCPSSQPRPRTQDKGSAASACIAPTARRPVQGVREREWTGVSVVVGMQVGAGVDGRPVRLPRQRWTRSQPAHGASCSGRRTRCTGLDILSPALPWPG